MRAPVVHLVNQSTIDLKNWLPSGKTLADVAAALTSQARNEFAAAWGHTADVALDGSVLLSATDRPIWPLYLIDDSDQAGALGYHDIDASGNPILKVFVKDTLAAGESVTVDLSHELLESLADPFCDLCAQDANGTIWAYEVCDAVEEETYQINGVTVSNFVLPRYFESPAAAGVSRETFDQLGTLTQPFSLAPGGYLSYAGAGVWHQAFGGAEAKQRHVTRAKHRARIRARRLIAQHRRAHPQPLPS